MENTCKITYRKLTEADLPTFIQMRITQLREEGAKEDFDLVPALKDYYKRHLKEGTFVSWLALAGEKIIGTSGMSFVEKPPYFVCPSGKLGLLSSMFTNPDYRRKGIAEALVDGLVEALKERGSHCLTLEVRASNAPAIALYEKLGFSEIGRRKNYYRNPREDALILRKEWEI